MADAVFSFELEGNGEAALEQADALEKLREKLVEDTAALSEMNKAFRALKGSAHAGGEGFRRLKDQIAAQKAAIANSHAGVLKLGGNFKNLKKPTVDAKSGLDELVSGMKGSGGPLGRLTGGLEKLKGLGAGGALAAGFAAIAAALVVVTAAAAAAGVALLKFGLAAADAYRAERLQLEGLTKLPNWFGIAAGKASDLQAALDRVSASVALSKGEIAGMQASLYQAGLRGAALDNALQGVATATAAAGEQGGAYARNLFMSLGHTAAGAKKAGDTIKARFGAVAAAQMLSLSVQSKKLKESFAALFTGLKLERFLGAMKSITDLFSQNTFSGRALKTILETMFQPMIDFASNHGILVKRFFQGLVIGAQLLVLGVLKLRNWFRKTFGDSEILKGIDKQKLAVYAGAAAVGALVGAFVGLAAVLAAVAAPFVLIGYQVFRFVKGLYDAYQAVTSIDWAGAGSALVNGIADGIKNGAQWVIDAVRDLGSSALKAFKEKLSIASPSKLFARLGVELPRGAAVGIRAGAPQLTAATRDMAAESGDAYAAAPPLMAQPTAPAAAPSAGARRVATINLGGLTVNVEVQGDSARSVGEDIGRIVVEKVNSMLEGVAIQLGAQIPEPVPT